ncbi:DUF4124 domain-containing protein [Aliikangiella sp. G2MR2-5]|uniref:DUF4124 domain-containing protein n=1 Tax=Aliikangiella sp. G2MR2-5 TaxID=2788943 RepID=UPI0018A8EE92|nr:DUF4124 domain-containing protein [Aliikangiella sp. G2MR2-5]
MKINQEKGMKGVANSLISSVFCMLFCQMAISGEIYKWTDEKGRVHYSDKPANKSKKVESKKVELKNISSVKGDPDKVKQATTVLSKSLQKNQQSNNKSSFSRKISANTQSPGLSDKEIKSRITACRKANNVDCSRSDIIKQKRDEDWINSPGGKEHLKRVSEQARQRKEAQQRRIQNCYMSGRTNC